MVADEELRLEIAIIGAGIAGLTAAIALRRHPHINVTIYEKATELKEIGASIALGPNGLRTLQRLGLHSAIGDDIAFRGPANIPMIYRHWKTNEIIGGDNFINVQEHLHRTARFYRAHLHQALLEKVPLEIINLQKKLLSVDDIKSGVKLSFRDGTSATADILIGADGINSGVRNALVPDFPLQWSGWTAIRAIFDTSRVESIPELPHDSAHWWGPTTSFFASRLGGNKFTIVGGIQDDPSNPSAVLKDKSWDQDASLQSLQEIYKDWNPLIKALIDATPPDALRFHPNLACSSSLDTWVFRDRITLVGDAAHAHGGAHATGGSLAIDDAYALYLSLCSVFPPNASRKPTVNEIGNALRLYQSTRKPHADKLLAKVHAANTARVQKLRIGGVESDEELRYRALKGSDTTWLHEHDVVREFEESLHRSKEFRGQNEDNVVARL